MDLRSKKRRPVNDRVALFVWVPGRIGEPTRQLTGRCFEITSAGL